LGRRRCTSSKARSTLAFLPVVSLEPANGAKPSHT
jgi:hypothetical protein